MIYCLLKLLISSIGSLVDYIFFQLIWLFESLVFGKNNVIMQEESEVKWLPLRLNIIPLLDKQARSVLDLYLATRKEILEGDILSIQKLIRIKEEVRANL